MFKQPPTGCEYGNLCFDKCTLQANVFSNFGFRNMNNLKKSTDKHFAKVFNFLHVTNIGICMYFMQKKNDQLQFYNFVTLSAHDFHQINDVLSITNK